MVVAAVDPDSGSDAAARHFADATSLEIGGAIDPRPS